MANDVGEERNAGALRYAGVKHLSATVLQTGHLMGAETRPSDRVVIPARNEQEHIGATLGYLLGTIGYDASQIMVVINGTTDDTEASARRVAPDVTIVHQEGYLKRPGLREKLQQDFGVAPHRLHGKGTAIFTACLALADAGTEDDARIFFLDADIRNVAEVDPIGHLLGCWKAFGEEVRHVKLASQGRNNEGILAYLARPGNPYASIGALMWPLCGQMSIRWGDLKRVRGANGYAIEMAICMYIIERYGSAAFFGEVELVTPLRDRPNTDRTHTRMYTPIEAHMDRLSPAGHWKPLMGKKKEELQALNRAETHSAFMPAEPGQGPNRFEEFPLDVYLPSVHEFWPFAPAT